jgi:hypothetical protein
MHELCGEYLTNSLLVGANCKRLLTVRTRLGVGADTLDRQLVRRCG